jgi:transposase
VFGSPVELVWLKRRWRCPEPACPVGSWTEDRPDIAPARAAMTSRAGQWAKHLRHATTVADPFHVVATGNRVVDRTRRRVQQQTLGHRGRKHDPLYRIRKLLVLAAERLDEHGQAKLRGLLAAGDPHGEVHEAWQAKEALRDLYTFWGDEPVARQWLNDGRTAWR